MQDIQAKEPVLSHVRKVIDKSKRKIASDLRDTTISEVQNLEENFQKVIGFARKYSTISKFRYSSLSLSS